MLSTSPEGDLPFVGANAEVPVPPAPPGAVIALSRRAGCLLLGGSLSFLLLGLSGTASFWPLHVDEDFEAYLRCDGPQHARLKWYAEAAAAAKDNGGHARVLQSARRLSERNQATWFIKVIYSTPDGSNIFTPAHLAHIRATEEKLVGCASYENFCFAGGGNKCYPPLSVINYFYASEDKATGDLIPDGKGAVLQDVEGILAGLATESPYFVDRYFGTSSSSLTGMLEGNITRSALRFGLPLHGFRGSNDRRPEQDALFRKFVVRELFPVLQEAAAILATQNLQMNFYGNVLTSYELEATVWHDAMYATGSLVFVGLYLVLHLRSVFLALSALGCIALSFPLTYTVYCLVFGYGKMIAINFLSLFVVLGVGADDVFVLADVWAHSRPSGASDMILARRLWDMYRKAGMAIFATSATTAASFFANLASSIGPLRQFGGFMGTCISINWVVVATLYPFILVVHDRWSLGRFGGRCLQMSPGNQRISVGDGVEMEQQLVLGEAVPSCDTGLHGGDNLLAASVHADVSPLGSVYGRVAKLLPRRVIVCGLCLSGLVFPLFATVSSARRIKPETGEPEFFPPSSNLGALQRLQMRFGNESSVQTLKLTHCDADGTLRSSGDCAAVASTVAARIPKHLLKPAKAGSTAQAPVATPAPHTGRGERRDFDLRFAVHGTSRPELDVLSVVLKGKVLQDLGLRDDNVDVVVDNGRRSTRPKDAAVLEVRRLSGIPMGGAGMPSFPDEAPSILTLHFHGLTPEQENQVHAYVAQHQREFQAYGVTGLPTVPAKVGAPSSTTRPHYQPTWRSMPATAVSTTRSTTTASILARTASPTSHSTHTSSSSYVKAKLSTSKDPRTTRSTSTSTSTNTSTSTSTSTLSTSTSTSTTTATGTTSPRPIQHQHQNNHHRNDDDANTGLSTRVTTTSMSRADFASAQPQPAPDNGDSESSPSTTTGQIVDKASTSTSPRTTSTGATSSTSSSSSSTSTITATGTTSPRPIQHQHQNNHHRNDDANTGFTTRVTTTSMSRADFASVQPQLAPDNRDSESSPSTTTAQIVDKASTTGQIHRAPVVSFHERGMTKERQSRVYLIWGLAPGRASNAYTEDEHFDMRSPLGQIALTQTCERAAATPALKITEVHCWPADFQKSLKSKGKHAPSNLQSIDRDLQSFFSAQKKLLGSDVGIRPGSIARPAWVRVSFRVEIDVASSGRQIEPYMMEWENFAEAETRRAKERGAAMLGQVVPMSDLFQRAEAELRVIGSALSSWFVSVGCALIAVGTFTRSCMLSVLATFAIFATGSCSLYTIICIFEWRFGLMEAVSLIIFCGFSVDYPLHVVQTYVQERSHGAKVSNALREVGCAVASGCMTTCGAALFLLLCEIRIFTRFGQVLIVNMLYSLIFALVWIPAMLECKVCSWDVIGRIRRPAADARSIVAGSDALEGVASHGFLALSGGTPLSTPRSRC